MFIEKNIKTGLVYYSDILPQLEHFFTTRKTVLKSKEKNINVEPNIIAVCDYLRISPNNLITPQQRHTDNIEIVKEGVNTYNETDALILSIPNKAIYLNFADCTPVILYDKKNNIGAIAHAGWRGTAQSIVPKTIAKMNLEFGTLSSDIIAVIGPAIGKCCYEVDKEVIDKISKTVKNKKDLWEKQLIKFYLDLKMVNKQQLIESGVPDNQIDVCPACTSCRNDIFFSYRKENGTTSRHSAVIKLK